MNARRLLFDFKIAGQQFFGVAFESERERDIFAVDRGITATDRLAPASALPEDPDDRAPARPRGRPSTDAIISATVTVLGSTVSHSSLSERARAIRREITKLAPADVAPSVRTIARHLGARPVGQKSGQKSGRATPPAERRFTTANPGRPYPRKKRPWRKLTAL